MIDPSADYPLSPTPSRRMHVKTDSPLLDQALTPVDHLHLPHCHPHHHHHCRYRLICWLWLCSYLIDGRSGLVSIRTLSHRLAINPLSLFSGKFGSLWGDGGAPSSAASSRFSFNDFALPMVGVPFIPSSANILCSTRICSLA